MLASNQSTMYMFSSLFLYKMTKTTYLTFLLLVFAVSAYGQEICDNGIDDDSDGLVDIADDECDCADLFDDTVYIPNGDFEATLTCCIANDFAGGDCLESWKAITYSPELVDPDCFTDLAEGERIIGAELDNNIIGLVYNDFGSFDLKETFGTCTNATLEQGNLYRLSIDLRMSTNPEKTSGDGSNPALYFYGLQSCDELVTPDVIQVDFCDLDLNLIPLDSIPFDEAPFGEWNTVTRDFRPSENVEAIVIGFLCDATSRNDIERFILMDNIEVSRLLNQQFDYNLDMAPVGSMCEDNFSISSAPIPDVSYQWYKDEVALTGENSNTLAISREEDNGGNYILRITDANGCFESDSVGVVVDALTIDTMLCAGKTFDITTGSFDTEGSYNEDITSRFGCENRTYNLSYQELIVGDTIVDSYQEGTSYSFAGERYDMEGNYDVLLETAEGCDSMVVLSLTEIDFTIRVPNIFTPSESTDNTLTVYGKVGSAVMVRRFRIHDRWGNQLFSRRNFAPNETDLGWTGLLKNGNLAQGIYSYFVEMEFIDGQTRQSSGDVLILR